MSLFGQLQRLYRREKFQLEDFHTEIVAQVLRNSRALTLAWLCEKLQVTKLRDPDLIKVVTQEEFPALAGHATDSRPDIAIRLAKDNRTELLLVESKIGSKAGPDQLKRYAEQLAARRELHQAVLIFITRDFEPVHSEEFAGFAPAVPFRQTRWFEFYEVLKAHVNGDGLAAQLKLFMEENRMSLHNQFRSVDVLALESFLGAKALMDETLWSEVATDFKATLGTVSSQAKALTQLRDYDRYVMYAGFGDKWDFEVLLGYWLPKENPADSVRVGIDIGANPKSDIGKRAISALRSFSKTNGWEGHDLNPDSEWGWISKTKSLQAFMAQNDHPLA